MEPRGEDLYCSRDLILGGQSAVCPKYAPAQALSASRTAAAGRDRYLGMPVMLRRSGLLSSLRDHGAGVKPGGHSYFG